MKDIWIQLLIVLLIVVIGIVKKVAETLAEYSQRKRSRDDVRRYLDEMRTGYGRSAGQGAPPEEPQIEVEEKEEAPRRRPRDLVKVDDHVRGHIRKGVEQKVQKDIVEKVGAIASRTSELGALEDHVKGHLLRSGLYEDDSDQQGRARVDLTFPHYTPLQRAIVLREVLGPCRTGKRLGLERPWT